MKIRISELSLLANKFNSSDKVLFWYLYYTFPNDNSRYSCDKCNNLTGYDNESTLPENGIVIDGKQVGCGLFQLTDENNNYKYTPGINLKWKIKADEATLHIQIIMLHNE